MKSNKQTKPEKADVEKNSKSKEQIVVLRTDFFKTNNYIESLKKWSLVSIVFAFVIFLFFASLSVFNLFTPHFVTTDYVSVNQIVNYTPDKYMVTIILESKSENHSFGDIYDRLAYVKTYLKSHWKLKPTITPYLYKNSYYENNTRKEKQILRYTISGQLKDVNIDWSNIINKSDGLTISLEMSKDLEDKLEQKSEKLAREKLDKKADEDGRHMFLIYFGKVLKSIDKSCGNDYYPVYETVRSNKMASGIVAESIANPSEGVTVGEKNGNCDVSASYALYGINLGGMSLNGYSYD